jgi:enolase-phosphatase E1
MTPQVILLDIEGTTTPIDFVFQTLFPYARQHARDFLEAHEGETDVFCDIVALEKEYEDDRLENRNPPVLPDHSIPSLETYIHWLIDQDRKSTPLKSLQGKIWEEGYRKGELKSDVYPDVPPAFARWTAQGRKLCIYSSGSVLAQQLLFGYTTVGDLRPMLSGYFDTRVGAKQESESYQRIAANLRVAPSQILFLSDVTGELRAARAAGLQTMLVVRPGNKPQPEAEEFPRITDFDGVLPA